MLLNKEVLEKIVEEGYLLSEPQKKQILSASEGELSRIAKKYGIVDTRSSEEIRVQKAVAEYRALRNRLKTLVSITESNGDIMGAISSPIESSKAEVKCVRTSLEKVEEYLTSQGWRDAGALNSYEFMRTIETGKQYLSVSKM